MRVRWFGQSAFHLGDEARGGVFIDPFDADIAEAAAAHGLRFAYPPIAGVRPDLLLVTHEHFDHNGVAAIGEVEQVVRSTAGLFETPAGPVVGIAGDHDDVAGSARGPTSFYVLAVDGVRVCHLGDLGQRSLRPEQVAAIGEIDLLFVPVGGSATIGGASAAAIVELLNPVWAVPMHYRTPALDFLEPVDEFVSAFPPDAVRRLDTSSFDTGEHPRAGRPTIVVPAPPLPA